MPEYDESPRRLFQGFRPENGWGAFLYEITVVLIGVFLALGLDQLAQLRRESVATAAVKENIQLEIQTNLSKLTSRLALEPCLEKRLIEVASLLDEKAALPSPISIGRPPAWHISNSRWEAATNAGGVSILTAEEQSKYWPIYKDFEIFEKEQEREQNAWSTMRALQSMDRLTEHARWELKAALQQARYAIWRARGTSYEALGFADQLGIKPEANAYPGSRSACLPMNLTREEVILRLGKDYANEPK